MESTDDCRHFYSNILDLHRRLFKVHFHRNLSLWRPHQTLIKILLLKCAAFSPLYTFSLFLWHHRFHTKSLLPISLSLFTISDTLTPYFSHTISFFLYILSLFFTISDVPTSIYLLHNIFFVYIISISHTLSLLYTISDIPTSYISYTISFFLYINSLCTLTTGSNVGFPISNV